MHVDFGERGQRVGRIFQLDPVELAAFWRVVKWPYPDRIARDVGEACAAGAR